MSHDNSQYNTDAADWFISKEEKPNFLWWRKPESIDDFNRRVQFVPFVLNFPPSIN